MNKDFTGILNSPRFRIGSHILFWVLVLIYYTFFFGHQQGYYFITFKFVVLLMPITIVTTYFFNYFLIPKYLLKNRIKEFLLFSIYAMVASFWITSLVFLPTISFIGPGPGVFDKTLIDLYFVIVGLYSVSILAIVIKLFKTWYEQRHQSNRILQEKTEAELAMLKGQINPHFLFNTLNNIYALALKKSDLTAESVLKLSEMLDYLLYECDAETVSIRKEINLIENYVYLQRLRYGDRLVIQIETRDACDEQIPPMLLLPFVENSFKHGAGKQSKKVWIHVKVSIEHHFMNFRITNSITTSRNSIHQVPASGGIGLENVKKRLQLLYQNRYSLEIENLSDTFNVLLKIPVPESV